MSKKRKQKPNVIQRLFSKDMSQGVFLVVTISLVLLLVIITTAAALQITNVVSNKQVQKKSDSTLPVIAKNDDETNASVSQAPSQPSSSQSQKPQASEKAKSFSPSGSPSFSINPSQISLTAGESSPSIKLQSTSGKVYWKIEGSSTAVYSMLDNNVSLHAAITTASFHIATSESAAAKTYQFTVRASTDFTFRSNVTSKTLSVTVNPRKDFKVTFSVDEASVDDATGHTVIPFTITRIGGHTDALVPMVTIVHAAGFHSIGLSVTMTSANSGRVTAAVPPGTPPGDYIVSVSARDSKYTTHSDECVLEVY